MIQCEGQMSLMDLLTPVATDNEPPRLLSVGQTVYKVVRESWKELNADNLVKEVKTNEIANRIVDNLAGIVANALAEY